MALFSSSVHQSDRRLDAQREQTKPEHRAFVLKDVSPLLPNPLQLQTPLSHIDRHNLPIIAFLDLSANLRLINLIATSSELFFAVAGLSNCHRLDLVSTVPLHSTLLHFTLRYGLLVESVGDRT
jgi:hypothetical protein